MNWWKRSNIDWDVDCLFLNSLKKKSNWIECWQVVAPITYWSHDDTHTRVKVNTIDVHERKGLPPQPSDKQPLYGYIFIYEYDRNHRAKLVGKIRKKNPKEDHQFYRHNSFRFVIIQSTPMLKYTTKKNIGANTILISNDNRWNKVI